MHPAYSVIFFTVSSGAGFGLLAWLGLAPLFGVAPSGALYWGGFVIGFVLSVAGLLSSTFHLGHPERAWRALTQWRSSWLSREGVIAIATLAVAALYAVLILFFSYSSVLLGLILTVLCVATVCATAMIYASLRTVQRWNQRLTMACYVGFSLASGAILFMALRAAGGDWSGGGVVLALILLVAAWGIKHLWWRRGDEAAPLSTPESATGLGDLGRVRLFESPHSNENYLLKEMGFRIARKHALKLRRVAMGLGGLVPVVLLLLALVLPGGAFWLALAALSHLAGLLVERWLFFAEARHAVMAYYS